MNFVPESGDMSRKDRVKSEAKDKENFKDPEEKIDDRPLFERLKEEKNKRFHEIIAGLDEDEADYLNAVAMSKKENIKKIDAEVAEMIKEKFEHIEHVEVKPTSNAQKSNQGGSKLYPSQKNVLSGIKRKSTKSHDSNKKKSAMKCLAVLPGIPGISDYNSSSDGSDKIDSSDSSDDEAYFPMKGRDFIGRKIVEKPTEPSS